MGMNIQAFQNHKEFREFVGSLQQRYADACYGSDSNAMIEASAGLCIAYSAIGNTGLASKWAEAYLSHLASYQTS